MRGLVAAEKLSFPMSASSNEVNDDDVDIDRDLLAPVAFDVPFC